MSGRWRVTTLTLLAAVVYGGWAFLVNLMDGVAAASRAGLAQATSSAASTLVITATIEAVFAFTASSRFGVALSILIPPTLTAMLHVLLQWIVGTRNILITVAPSVIIGYIFAAVYVTGLVRLTRRSAPGKYKNQPVRSRRRQE